MGYEKAFQQLNMLPTRYLLVVAVPLIGVGFVLSLTAVLFADAFLPSALARVLPILLMAFAVGVAAVWPLAEVDRRKRQIDDALPFFMTHFGVLSTSNMPRTEIIHMLAKKKEYKALSSELERLHDLVTNWNLSMPDAARHVSDMTPSRIFADFLERLAYALETGQDLENFLRAEQAVVLREYAALYDNAVYKLEGWKDLYLSAVMSGAFFVIFATMVPILIGGNIVTLLVGVLAFILVLELLLMFLLKGRLPADRLLHRLSIITPESKRHEKVLQLSIPAAVFIMIGLFFAGIRFEYTVMAAVLPLAGAGIWSQRQEGRVKRREENYPAFVRSLGSAAQARGGSLSEVLAHVRAHNFGPLTDLVDRLFVRLTWRLDDERSWNHFSAESGSYLIDAFNNMFVEGAESGGKPGVIGEMISENVVRILGLRTGRYSTAETFRGLLFSMTGGMAFVMFIGSGLIGSISRLFEAAFENATATQIPLGFAFVFDAVVVNNIILGILIAHGLIGGVLVKMMEGGRATGGLLYFAVLVWISVIVGLTTTSIAPNLMGV